MRIALLVLLVLLPIAGSGCATTRARNAYLRQLDRHTEEMRVYRGFATALLLRGTYLSPEMREALAVERQRLMGAASDDHASFVANMQEEVAAYWDVVFSAESPIDPKTPRFGEDDASWRLRLVADGLDQPLITVYRVKDPTLLQQSLYAHKNAWNELYVARFERTVPSPGALVLHVGSGFGHDELRWTGDELR